MEPVGAAETETLPDRIRRGDQDAEEELVRQFGGRVFALALARTRDRDAASDLQQETLWAVLQALRSGALRDTSKLAAFVCGTARNLTNNYLRTLGRMPRHSPLAAEAAFVPAPDPAEAAEQIERIRRALRFLDATDRRILLLTLHNGMKSGEIAADLRLTSEVVRQRKTRAIRRVIELLKDASRT